MTNTDATSYRFSHKGSEMHDVGHIDQPLQISRQLNEIVASDIVAQRTNTSIATQVTDVTSTNSNIMHTSNYEYSHQESSNQIR